MSNERASFTAGPWSQYHDDPLVIVNANGSSLGEASAGDPFISYSEQLANARLIAAAPDLLDALQALRKACDAVRPFQQSIAAHTVNDALDVKAFLEAVKGADAALAKATGSAA